MKRFFFLVTYCIHFPQLPQQFQVLYRQEKSSVQKCQDDKLYMHIIIFRQFRKIDLKWNELYTQAVGGREMERLLNI